MQDLTARVYRGDPISVLAPTSQAGGNMMSDSREAMTAPGSEPVDPLPDRDEQDDPKVTASPGPRISPGDDGKPQASRERGYNPPAPAWKNTH